MSSQGCHSAEVEALKSVGTVLTIFVPMATLGAMLWSESRTATRHAEATKLARTEIRLHDEENDRDAMQYRSSIRPILRFERFAAAAYNSSQQQVGCKYCGDPPLIKNIGTGAGSDIKLSFLVTAIGDRVSGKFRMRSVKPNQVSVYPAFRHLGPGTTSSFRWIPEEFDLSEDSGYTKCVTGEVTVMSFDIAKNAEQTKFLFTAVMQTEKGERNLFYWFWDPDCDSCMPSVNDDIRRLLSDDSITSPQPIPDGSVIPPREEFRPPLAPEPTPVDVDDMSPHKALKPVVPKKEPALRHPIRLIAPHETYQTLPYRPAVIVRSRATINYRNVRISFGGGFRSSIHRGIDSV